MNFRYKNIIENYIKAYNNFDVLSMLKDLQENIEFQNISNGNVDMKIHGLEEFRKQAESALTYFSTRQQNIESWKYEDQLVVIDIDYNAKLAIDFPNGLKKGDVIKMKGKSEFQFQNNKIISIKDIS